MTSQNQYFHPELIIVDHFDDIINQIDIKTESFTSKKILELDDNEKFVDVDNNIIEIEVRGTRDIDDVYFKVKDVGEKFGLGDVTHTLLQQCSSFEKDNDYKLFKIIKMIKNQSDAIKKNKNNRHLFLTFAGLTKLLFVSKSKNARHFQKWAIKVLFTHKLGTEEDKFELASSLLGVDPRIIKYAFSANYAKTPCVYLFSIGKAKDLLKDDKYSDNDILCKYGCTDDLPRRTNEHEKF